MTIPLSCRSARYYARIEQNILAGEKKGAALQGKSTEGHNDYTPDG
jgi:hypothetical protein